MLAIYFLSAITAALAGSFWIDCLYKMPNAPLTFPEKIHGKNYFRKIFIATFFFAAIILNAELPKFLAAYNITAIFFLLLITATDFEQYIIFDKMLLPFAIASLPFIIILELPLLNHLSAAIFGGGIFFILMLISKNGIGGGDVKLVAVLGLWLGSEGLIFVVWLGTILAGVFALFFLLTKIKKRKDFFAYGPYLCTSAAYYLIFSNNLFRLNSIID